MVYNGDAMHYNGSDARQGYYGTFGFSWCTYPPTDGAETIYCSTLGLYVMFGHMYDKILNRATHMQRKHIIPKYFKHVKTYSILTSIKYSGSLGRPYKEGTTIFLLLGWLWETTSFPFQVFQAPSFSQPTEAESQLVVNDYRVLMILRYRTVKVLCESWYVDATLYAQADLNRI